MNLAIYAILAFGILGFYVKHVSPMIGMGATGMLSAAVASGGFGPVPNFPVHNMLARFTLAFNSIFEFGRPDYVLNLLSFVMATASLLLLTWILAMVIEHVLKRPLSRLALVTTGAILSLFYYWSSGLTKPTYFGDRYTVDLFFVALAVGLGVHGALRDDRILTSVLWLCFLSTFQFFCHPKSLPLTWFCALVLFWKAYHRGVQLPKLRMFAMLALGLLPVVYAPLVSQLNPLFDWGNPENFTNLMNALTRKEYSGLPLVRSWSEIGADFRRQYQLLFSHVAWPALLLVPIGVAFLFKSHWRMGLACLALWLVAGDVTTALIHIPAYEGVPGQMAEHYMLNYYAPLYALAISLATLGLVLLVHHLPRSAQPLALTLSLVIALFGHHRIQSQNSKASFALPSELVNNYEVMLPEQAVLFTNVDGLYAPLIYHQVHHERLQSRAVIHLELLFRSWYYDDLRTLYPELWQQHKSHFEKLSQFIKDFEQSGFNKKHFKLKVFVDAINAIAADHNQGAFVYVDPEAQPLRPGLFHPFQWEPEGLSFRLMRGSYRIASMPFDQLSFDQLKLEAAKGDFWALRFRNIYTRIFELREQRSRVLESEELPRLRESLAQLAN